MARGCTWWQWHTISNIGVISNSQQALNQRPISGLALLFLASKFQESFFKRTFMNGCEQTAYGAHVTRSPIANRNLRRRLLRQSWTPSTPDFHFIFYPRSVLVVSGPKTRIPAKWFRSNCTSRAGLDRFVNSVYSSNVKKTQTIKNVPKLLARSVC